MPHSGGGFSGGLGADASAGGRNATSIGGQSIGRSGRGRDQSKQAAQATVRAAKKRAVTAQARADKKRAADEANNSLVGRLLDTFFSAKRNAKNELVANISPLGIIEGLALGPGKFALDALGSIFENVTGVALPSDPTTFNINLSNPETNFTAGNPISDALAGVAKGLNAPEVNTGKTRSINSMAKNEGKRGGENKQVNNDLASAVAATPTAKTNAAADAVATQLSSNVFTSGIGQQPQFNLLNSDFGANFFADFYNNNPTV